MDKIKNQLQVSVKNFVDEGDGVISFPQGLTITDDTEMRSGTRYDINSLSTDSYQGQLTADHVDTLSNLIGKTIGVVKSGNRVAVQGIKYAVNENPYAKLAYDLLVGGFSDSFSIETIGMPYDNDGVFKDHELVGLSQVVVPNNYNAKVNALVKNSLEVSKNNGLDITGIEEKIKKDNDSTIDVETEVVEPEAEKVEEPTKTETDNKEKEPEEVVEVDDTTDETEEKKENMTKEELAAEAVVEQKAEIVVEQPKKVVVANKTEIRKNFVQQLKAAYANNTNELRRLAEEGAEMEGIEKNSLDLSGVYLSEVLKADVKQAFYDAGGVGTLVQREDITGATLLNLPVETRGTGFQATALGAVKSEDAPVWATVEVRPYEWALIVQWSDAAAVQTPIAVYNYVVRYIANQYKVLEDKIILTYAGGTVGSENRDATGLAPLLEAAHRSSAVTGLTAQYLVPALANAFGNIQSDGTLTIVANRATWSQMAVAQDANYNTVFNVVGNQVTIGALGTFNVVTSEALSNNEIVVGNMADYVIATQGGLATLFSQEATVGAVNLFTQNGSALRASVNIAGTAVPVTSFWLLTGSGFVS